MNKQFSFSIKVKGAVKKYSFTIPVKNGFVITNYFCPNSLLIGEGPLANAITPMQGETEEEFIQDCQNIVNESNNISEDDAFTCLGLGLMHVVWHHIDKFGRILFQDFLIYMDCFAYLLRASGYAESEVKRVYPIIAKQLLDTIIQYVKDSHTLLPFHITKCYKTLCSLAAQ